MNAKALARILLCAVAIHLQAVSGDEVRQPAAHGPKTVLCWGDSITEGMAMPRGKDYPGRLQALLGTGWKVLNSGDGGEDAVTIPARQGAFPLAMSAPVVFPAGVKTVKLGDAADNGIRTAQGDRISLTAALGRQIPVNPVRIGGRDYTLSFEGFRWNTPTNRITYTLNLSRADAGEAETIPAGTPAAFASAACAPEAACEIYLMGANGGWNNDVDHLVSLYRAMIARRSEAAPYLVIEPYWLPAKQKEAFRAAFGERLVPFCPTVEQCYRKRRDVHLNEEGYDLLAKAVFARGRALGYW